MYWLSIPAAEKLVPRLVRAALAAASAWSLPWMPLWDLTFWSRVGRACLARTRSRSLMARRRGRWTFSSIDAGSLIVLSMRCRLARLSVKRVSGDDIRTGSCEAWRRHAQRAASSARVMVLVSFRPAGETIPKPSLAASRTAILSRHSHSAIRFWPAQAPSSPNASTVWDPTLPFHRNRGQIARL